MCYYAVVQDLKVSIFFNFFISKLNSFLILHNNKVDIIHFLQTGALRARFHSGLFGSFVGGRFGIDGIELPVTYFIQGFIGSDTHW